MILVILYLGRVPIDKNFVRRQKVLIRFSAQLHKTLKVYVMKLYIGLVDNTNSTTLE